ncbi:hypothetical protein WMF26_31335 [Sorangium sp. So ce185]
MLPVALLPGLGGASAVEPPFSGMMWTNAALVDRILCDGTATSIRGWCHP